MLLRLYIDLVATLKGTENNVPKHPKCAFKVVSLHTCRVQGFIFILQHKERAGSWICNFKAAAGDRCDPFLAGFDLVARGEF